MNITVFSTTTCTTCHILTEWLDKNGHAYTKKVADEDPEAMIEFMSVNDGMVGVPFTVVTKDDGSVVKIAGYDIKQFQSALA